MYAFLYKMFTERDKKKEVIVIIQYNFVGKLLRFQFAELNLLQMNIN